MKNELTTTMDKDDLFSLAEHRVAALHITWKRVQLAQIPFYDSLQNSSFFSGTGPYIRSSTLLETRHLPGLSHLTHGSEGNTFCLG